MLHIRLLGDFCLHNDDALVTVVNTARLQSLLAYLVLHRHVPQSRLRVAGLFWPDSTEAQARTNLRHQLHLLREVLPQADCFVQADARTLQWRPDAPFRLDVDEFESVVSGDASVMVLHEAIDIYGGDLLPGCYDDWILPERERLQETFVDALGRLIVLLEHERDYATAICYAQRLQRHDLLCEATYRHLMRLYALNGDQAGAQRTYQDCAVVLQRELGAQPSPATRQAYEHLMQANANAQITLTSRHNLPARLTSFVGRERELTQLAELLADPACRLLTVVGAGGIGKTRLAIEAARDHIAAYSHGVYLVSLNATSAAEFILSAIADSLAFAFHGSQEPKVQLLNYLHEKEMLLILDNFEHLLAGAGLLVEILNSAPMVKLLVTSRERLRLHGEWVYEVHGLAVPKADDGARVEDYSAAQLFLQCARRVRRDFALPTEERSALVRVCQLVEGMPLGLELAAAWMHVMSCDELMCELVQSSDLLTTTSPHVPERHRSIRAVFDHSRNLLSAEEQHVFRRLSVFQGGFRREAAEQVAGASLPLLAALADKSLLRWRREGRYEMHELVRQYAAEQLAAVPAEQEATHNRHARYYLEFLHQQEPALKSIRQERAMGEIKREIDNVRLACHCAIAQTWAKELGQAAHALLFFYDIQGWLHEGEAIFGQAVDTWAHEQERQRPDPANRERAIGLGQMLGQQGWFSLRLGLIGKAKALFQQGVALLRHLGARAELGDALQFFSMVAWASGDYREAQTILKEALTIHTERGASWSIALCLGVLGNVASALGNYGEAKLLLQQSVTLFKVVGGPRSTALALSYLIAVAHTLGDHSEAKQWLQESLTLSRAIGDRWSMVICSNELGAITARTGDLIEAKRIHEDCLTLAKELGDRREIAISLNHLGNVTRALTDFVSANRQFLAALKIAIESQATPLTLSALLGLATVVCHHPATSSKPDRAHKQGQAVEMLALVLNHPSADHETKGQAQQLLTKLEAELQPTIIASAKQRGRNRNLDSLVAEIMAEAGSG